MKAYREEFGLNSGRAESREGSRDWHRESSCVAVFSSSRFPTRARGFNLVLERPRGRTDTEVVLNDADATIATRIASSLTPLGTTRILDEDQHGMREAADAALRAAKESQRAGVVSGKDACKVVSELTKMRGNGGSARKSDQTEEWRAVGSEVSVRGWTVLIWVGQ